MRRRSLTGVPVALCLAALLALIASGCGKGSSSQAAVVNGTAIPVSQLKQQVSAKLGAASQSTASTAQDIVTLTQQSLDGLIQFQIVLDGAKKAGVAVTNEEIDARVNQIKQQATAQGSKFEDLLAQNNLTEDLLRQQLRVQLAVDHVAVKLVPYQPDAALVKIMNQHQADYVEVHVRHVLVKDQATATKVHDQLVKGGDWNAVAKQFSIDPGSKAKGGDLGFAAKGTFVAEFEKAAFGLAGQGDCKGKTSGTCSSPISNPVKSQYGYHVIQVTGVRLPALTDDLRSKLDPNITNRRQTAVNNWFSGLVKQAAVTVNPRFGRWDAASGHVVDRSTAPGSYTGSSTGNGVTATS